MTVYKSVSELIGGTPLVELTNYEKNNNLEAVIVGKVESFNPAGSVKDRVAKAMIDDALASGKIDADTVLIEPTSGNTGIGLAAIAAARGMRLIVPKSWRPRFPTRSSWGSSRTRRTRLSTKPLRAPRSGRLRAATWTSSWRAWARAAR